MPENHLKQCSASLVFRGMKIKPLRLRLIPVRMVTINKTNDSSCLQGCRVKGNSVLADGSTNMYSHCEKPVWKFHQKMRTDLHQHLIIILRHTLKEHFILLKRHLLNHVYYYSVHSSQKLQTVQMSIRRWMDKSTSYIFRTEYYLNVKRIIKFCR